MDVNVLPKNDLVNQEKKKNVFIGSFVKGNGCGMLVEVVTSTNGMVIFLGVTFPSRMD